VGSAVTYESLWARPELQVDLLITLGSLLALPEIVFPNLHPAPEDGKRHRPPGVRRWINMADPGDFIAVPAGLAHYFAAIDTHLTTPIGVFDTTRSPATCPVPPLPLSPPSSDADREPSAPTRSITRDYARYPRYWSELTR
jgi:hypothetical protein